MTVERMDDGSYKLRCTQSEVNELMNGLGWSFDAMTRREREGSEGRKVQDMMAELEPHVGEFA